MQLKFLLGAILVLSSAAIRPAAGADELLVSAAASLTDALGEVGKAYEKRNPGTTVRFNFAASGLLQQQIVHGAPVDVFASASPREMDALQRSGLIDAATRFDFAGNRLVLVAPTGSRIGAWEDLKAPSVHLVAISNPDSVPSGRYALETLSRRGLWEAVKSKAILGESVRQTLTYVTGRNVDAGVVFATDARAESRRVRVVQAAIPGRDHSPIVYPAAVLRRAPNPSGARKFSAFLGSPAGQSILSRYGFTPAAGASPAPERAMDRPRGPAARAKAAPSR
jgi:molybdate transport system substrate-binding protein